MLQDISDVSTQALAAGVSSSNGSLDRVETYESSRVNSVTPDVPIQSAAPPQLQLQLQLQSQVQELDEDVCIDEKSGEDVRVGGLPGLSGEANAGNYENFELSFHSHSSETYNETSLNDLLLKASDSSKPSRSLDVGVEQKNIENIGNSQSLVDPLVEAASSSSVCLSAAGLCFTPKPNWADTENVLDDIVSEQVATFISTAVLTPMSCEELSPISNSQDPTQARITSAVSDALSTCIPITAVAKLDESGSCETGGRIAYSDSSSSSVRMTNGIEKVQEVPVSTLALASVTKSTNVSSQDVEFNLDDGKVANKSLIARTTDLMQNFPGRRQRFLDAETERIAKIMMGKFFSGQNSL